MMQLSPAVLSAPARTAVAAMVKNGTPAVVQYERGERKAYFRDLRGKEKPVDPMAVDELVKAGIVADRQDGLFAGIGQTYEPKLHAVLKIRLGGVRTDKATGAKFRKAEVETTAGLFICEVCARAAKDAEALDGDGIKAEVRRLIAEKRPMLGGAPCGEEKPKPERVIVVNLIPYWTDKRGKGFRPGRIIGDGKIGGYASLQVELEPIGKERKPKLVEVMPHDLVPYTDALAEQIRAAARAASVTPAW